MASYFIEPRVARLAALAAAVLLLAGCGGDGAIAPETACAGRVNDTEDKLLACMTLDGVMSHLREFDRIARANGGHRASGSPGYEASGAYAERVLRDAGYAVTRSSFDFVRYENLGASVLRQVGPGAAVDFAHRVMDYSGSGDVSAAVGVVGGRGCRADDFAGFPPASIALIERGDCSFDQKIGLAEKAGAVGAVVYNNAEGMVHGALSPRAGVDIPVLEATQTLGRQLAATPGLVLRVAASTRRDPATTFNLVAEGRSGDENHVVMVGGHLDSVQAGPGINDNGSGSAAVLETAVQLARTTTRYRLRFALWGAEEEGVLGSADYVGGLAPEALAKIAMYLNFDMIGSPNPGYFIYDGDNSDGRSQGPGPAGSEVIEQTFERFYAARNTPFKGTPFDGRSDYGPFIELGIPAGGISSGVDEIKTEADVALWGGKAGITFDPCYHAACDDLANLDPAALEFNSKAVAAATLHHANDLRGILRTDPQGGAARTVRKGYTPPADMRPRHLPALR
ncbi:M28 family peptidase [Pigmentiphaga sp. YJ18]|uniref:M28 family peptidase n=1 Tax=Pigmentiphaga sp. YJ18 TaxID=3134907 RepID=UPI00310DE05E